MPMMLAQEASIIDIIGVPFLLPKPSGAVFVFEAVLAGAPHRACVQNGACKDAHDARTEGGLERSKTLPVLWFPYESARFWDARALRCPEAARGETEVPPTPKPTPKLNRLKPSTQHLSFVLQARWVSIVSFFEDLCML